MYQLSSFCHPNPLLVLLCVNPPPLAPSGQLHNCRWVRNQYSTDTAFLPSVLPHTGRRKIIYVKSSSSVGNPLAAFCLSHNVHPYMNPSVNLCQKCSSDLLYPDGSSVCTWGMCSWQFCIMSINIFQARHLTWPWGTSCPLCCSCAVPGC